MVRIQKINEPEPPLNHVFICPYLSDDGQRNLPKGKVMLYKTKGFNRPTVLKSELDCANIGSKMFSEPLPNMVYQYAFSVALVLVAGALSTQDPAYASFTRIVLTLFGVFTAAFAVALLDMQTNWQSEDPCVSPNIPGQITTQEAEVAHF